MAQIKAIIFDYFGVICSDEYWQFVKEDKNLERATFHELADKVNLGQISWKGFMAEVAGKTGRSPAETQRLYESQRIQPNMVAYIAELHTRYRTALLTNAHYEFLEPVIAATKLEAVFDAVVISSRVGIIKPSPDIFEYTVHQLGVKPEEAVMVDDIMRHIEGAQATGLHTVYYENFPQMKRDLEALLNANH
jgi:epoxide hydrolase-like predicted phosphatase